ncbi:MAG: FemAB family protein [Bacteroidetes bacterium HGW-Bacteroidetes-13]|nr:MAG: FemAB family protein [Bacteroidetes bacterium HGW-Bacteroidetes-13]
MKSYQIVRYLPAYQTEWDDFVANNGNATFLFYRDFMEYHQDWFDDASLLIFNQQKLVGILPGHRVERRFCSHRGLTYAGLIVDKKMGVSEIESVFNQLLTHLKKNDFDELEIKITPAFYQEKYNSAIEYFLFQKHAKLIRRDLNFLIDLTSPIDFHKTKSQMANRQLPSQLSIEKSSDFIPYWNQVLTPVLEKQYGAKPVHSLDEITLLAQKFPENIQLYQVVYNQVCVAGIVLFIHKKTVKSQYSAVNEVGKKVRALDYLYLFLIKKFQAEGFHYFDLGHANKSEGFDFEANLANYKKELGGRPVNADCYLLNL